MPEYAGVTLFFLKKKYRELRKQRSVENIF